MSGRLWVKHEESPGDAVTESILFSWPQSFVAKMLGVPVNRILVRVKRMGGGFGGKETRSTLVTVAVALAAYKWVPMGSGEKNKAASAGKTSWVSFVGKQIAFAWNLHSPLFIELLSIGWRQYHLAHCVHVLSPLSSCEDPDGKDTPHTPLPIPVYLYLVQHSVLVEKEGFLAVFISEIHWAWLL